MHTIIMINVADGPTREHHAPRAAPLVPFHEANL